MKSLRAKVFFGVLCGLLLTAFAAEIIVYRQAISFAEQAQYDSLRRYAIALNEIVYLDSNDQLKIHRNGEGNVKISKGDQADFFEFKKFDGTIISNSHNLVSESLPEVGLDRGYKLIDFGEILLGVYEYHFSLPTEKKTTLDYKLLVANNTAQVDTVRKSIIRSILLFTPLALLACIAVSIAVTAVTLSSINKFRVCVQDMEDTDTKSYLNLDDVDAEMKPLGKAFNSFIDQTNKQLVNESRVLANTAHELHTPLMKMHTTLELLQKSNLTNADYENGFKKVKKGITSLQRMTENMLLLYRIERGKYCPRLHLLDLQKELQRILINMKSELEEEGLSVRLQGESVKVCCNRSVIKLIIKQLIRNVCIYAPGSHIDIGWQKQHGKITLHIDDEGDGIPPDERERVFNRLYRLTHPIHSQPSGSGLGLSLVRLYAESINATTQCLESPSGGARFVIVLQAEYRVEAT